jgi:hypothetical protein
VSYQAALPPPQVSLVVRLLNHQLLTTSTNASSSSRLNAGRSLGSIMGGTIHPPYEGRKSNRSSMTGMVLESDKSKSKEPYHGDSADI